MDNFELQEQEIEVLKAIYENEWREEDSINRSFSIEVSEANKPVRLFFKFTSEYPTEGPPTYQLSAPYLSANEKVTLSSLLEECYLECLSQLLTNKKIANATHNIYAYRIKGAKKSFIQDCEDDGENHAGARLLHLLQMMDLENVLVIVSRWYGGILLGPDRFRHICNAARQVLVTAGYNLEKKKK